MYEDQGGLCACCMREISIIPQPRDAGSRADYRCVDHDHAKQKGEPGFIRGLLCLHCNALLGLAKENVETLRLAMAYLAKWKGGC